VTTPESALVRRARLRLGLGVGLAVTALLALVGGISYALLLRSQEAQIHRELAWGAANGTIAGPPACSWVFRFDHGTLAGVNSPPPPGFPLRDAADRALATGDVQDIKVTRNDTVYYVHTERRGDTVTQVVFDARFQVSDRRHLLWAFTLAALVGLLAAVLTGVLVGRRAVAPLIDALDRQRRFVADASHELRTPIAQVHTRAQLLARRAASMSAAARAAAAAPPVPVSGVSAVSAASGVSAASAVPAGEALVGVDRRELERLVDGTRRLGEIVEELLLSARLGATPAGRARATPVDLAALAADAVAAETDRAAERGQTLSLTTPGRPVPVPGIESALRRVLGELLTNALAHLPDGGHIGVTVLDPGGGIAQVVVADTGTGFDPADAKRIFDRFHRGAGTGDRRYGLGLALLREVVTSHGGTITAHTHPGTGATFTVRLPTGPPPDRIPRFDLGRFRGPGALKSTKVNRA